MTPRRQKKKKKHIFPQKNQSLSWIYVNLISGADFFFFNEMVWRTFEDFKL